MNKQQFLDTLKMKLSGKMNYEEIASLMEYYDGYIDEAVDFGMSEEEIVEQLGSIDDLVDELTKGLNDENIDVSPRELAIVNNDTKGLKVEVKDTNVYLLYDNDIDHISVKVDKHYKQDYLVKNIDGVFRVKQVSRSIMDGHSFSFSYQKPNINIDLKNGIFDFDFDFDFNVRNRSLYITVPRSWELETDIKTRDAKVCIGGDDERAYSKSMHLETRNSKIEIKNIITHHLHAETGNAKISLEDVDSDICELQTTNAKIELINGASKQLMAQTTNAKVELEEHQFIDAKIKTTNAKVHCLMKKNTQAKTIQFATSNNKVVIDGERYDTRGKLKIDGDEPEINLAIQTSNAKIELENVE